MFWVIYPDCIHEHSQLKENVNWVAEFFPRLLSHLPTSQDKGTESTSLHTGYIRT